MSELFDCDRMDNFRVEVIKKKRFSHNKYVVHTSASFTG